LWETSRKFQRDRTLKVCKGILVALGGRVLMRSKQDGAGFAILGQSISTPMSNSASTKVAKTWNSLFVCLVLFHMADDMHGRISSRILQVIGCDDVEKQEVEDRGRIYTPFISILAHKRECRKLDEPRQAKNGEICKLIIRCNRDDRFLGADLEVRSSIME
jgi:hypothetical protein